MRTTAAPETDSVTLPLDRDLYDEQRLGGVANQDLGAAAVEIGHAAASGEKTGAKDLTVCLT